MSNCCSHGTFLHFSLQSSHLNICYYHQDLHYWPFHPGSRPRLRHGPTRPPTQQHFAFMLLADFKSFTSAPSIFRASPFGR